LGEYQLKLSIVSSSSSLFLFPSLSPASLCLLVYLLEWRLFSFAFPPLRVLVLLFVSNLFLRKTLYPLHVLYGYLLSNDVACCPGLCSEISAHTQALPFLDKISEPRKNDLYSRLALYEITKIEIKFIF
jgi:hypothetical protein